MLANIRRRFPPWGRVRSVLGALGKPRSFVGWFLFLLDQGQRAQFLGGIVGKRMVALFQQWGWVAGLLWLAAVVLWAAARPSDTDKVRATERLRLPALDVLRRFEALNRAYEPNMAQYKQVIDPRWNFLWAVANLLEAALQTVPKEEQEQYRAILERILVDYDLYDDAPRSVHAGESAATMPIEIVLGKYPPTPPADPQPGAASEQSPPPSPECSGSSSASNRS